jgi:RNA polymerase sigma factor (sigma-70 family)
MISMTIEKPSKKVTAKPARAKKAAKAGAAAGRQEKPDYIYNRAFARPDTEQKLWGGDSPIIDVASYSLMPAIEGDRAMNPGKLPRLSADQEKTLFLRYNYAKYRLARLLDSDGKSHSADLRREAERWRRRAEQTREKLVHANLALVPSMAKRMRGSDIEFGELVSEGHLAILRSVEKFDVSRGFKFSTYACRAILACFRRMASKARKNSARFPVSFVPEMERSDYDERHHEQQRQDAVDMVRNVLQRNLANLNETEFRIIQERFSLTAEGKRRTLGQISENVCLSVERVRQIIKESLGKVRKALEAQFLS